MPKTNAIPRIRALMKLQVKQAGGDGELTVGSQKEFLQLFNRGVSIARALDELLSDSHPKTKS